MDSFDRFFEFMKRSNRVSPTVAWETANVLQVTAIKMTILINIHVVSELIIEFHE